MRADKRFVLSPEHELARRRSIKRARARRNYREEFDEPGVRCAVCGLLEPHECLDTVEVRQP